MQPSPSRRQSAIGSPSCGQSSGVNVRSGWMRGCELPSGGGASSPGPRRADNTRPSRASVEPDAPPQQLPSQNLSHTRRNTSTARRLLNSRPIGTARRPNRQQTSPPTGHAPSRPHSSTEGHCEVTHSQFPNLPLGALAILDRLAMAQLPHGKFSLEVLDALSQSLSRPYQLPSLHP